MRRPDDSVDSMDGGKSKVLTASSQFDRRWSRFLDLKSVLLPPGKRRHGGGRHSVGGGDTYGPDGRLWRFRRVAGTGRRCARYGAEWSRKWRPSWPRGATRKAPPIQAAVYLLIDSVRTTRQKARRARFLDGPTAAAAAAAAAEGGVDGGGTDAKPVDDGGRSPDPAVAAAAAVVVSDPACVWPAAMNAVWAADANAADMTLASPGCMAVERRGAVDGAAVEALVVAVGVTELDDGNGVVQAAMAGLAAAAAAAASRPAAWRPTPGTYYRPVRAGAAAAGPLSRPTPMWAPSQPAASGSPAATGPLSAAGGGRHWQKGRGRDSCRRLRLCSGGGVVAVAASASPPPPTPRPPTPSLRDHPAASTPGAQLWRPT